MLQTLNINILNKLTGPILDRELRACSRRKRYYLLRTSFIIVLILFITLVWMVATSFSLTGTSFAFRAMRMSIVSRSVIASVVGFEFIIMPLLATVMLSNSISREINKRTLETLLSTPINSLQIVLGKLFSSLLQILLLIGFTLPLFAIIRIFGGVPWDYIIVSLCMTLTTSCLFAILSLFFSIRIQHAHHVIGRIFLIGLLFFGLIPGVVNSLNSYYSWKWLPEAVHILEIINPFVGMSVITTAVMNSDPQGCSAFPWGRHCLIFIVVFVVMILLSTLRLRNTMLRLTVNRGGLKVKAKKVFGFFTRRRRSFPDGVPAEVKGNPIIWKELKSDKPSFLKLRFSTVMWTSITIAVFICAAYFKVLFQPEFHAVFVTGLTLIAFIRTATLAAQSVSKEKQTRTWPILLTTPIADKDILKMKATAILKQTMSFWIIIFGDVLLFSIILVLNPLSIFGAAIAIIPTVMFFIGIGMYFGMRLKTMTATIAVTYSVPIVLWVLCPCVVNFSPLALIAMSIGAGFDNESWWFTLIMAGASLIPGILYGVAGFVFFTLAASSMRKYIFNVSG